MKQVFLAKWRPLLGNPFITLSVHASFDGAAAAVEKHKQEHGGYGSVEQVEVLP